jgi:adenosylcobinamide-GDP ribazoletransferase
MLGLAVAGAYSATRLILPSIVAAGLALGVGIVLTGGLHEDGLADMADSVGGGWSREESLRILEDPRHGTYGVIALALGLLVKAGALASLDGWSALATLPAAHALSRGAAVGLLAVIEPAPREGLGAAYSTSMTGRLGLSSLGVGLMVGALSLGVWVVPGLALTVLGAGSVGWLARRRFGGVTGDVLGAAQQVGEVLVLLLGAAATVHAWPWMPWWR